MKLRDAGSTLIIFIVLSALIFGAAEIFGDKDEPKQTEETEE